MREMGAWFKSTRSNSNGTGGCVEVKVEQDKHPTEIHVRDTKLGEASPVLVFTLNEWRAFIGGVKDGEFDL